MEELSWAPRSTFLDLSCEVRLEIYRYCLLSRCTVNVSNGNFYVSFDGHERPDTTGMNLLVACKRISDECLDIIYGDNVFWVTSMDPDELAGLMALPEKNRRRIRRLAFNTTCWVSTCWPQQSPDVALWSPILEGLSIFLIGVYRGDTNDDDTRTRETEITWFQQSEQCLKFFGDHCDPETLVLTFSCGSKKILSLFDTFFPSHTKGKLNNSYCMNYFNAFLDRA